MRIGIDVGGSHIGLGLVNKDGKLVLKDEKDLNCTICHSSWSLLTRREKQYVWIKAKKLD